MINYVLTETSTAALMPLSACPEWDMYRWGLVQTNDTLPTSANIIRNNFIHCEENKAGANDLLTTATGL